MLSQTVMLSEKNNPVGTAVEKAQPCNCCPVQRGEIAVAADPRPRPLPPRARCSPVAPMPKTSAPLTLAAPPVAAPTAALDEDTII